MMKQMPYRVEEQAIERAKYRAKMAMREAARLAESRPQPRHIRRWAIAGALAVAIVGVVLTLTLKEERSTMDRLIATMEEMPDHILYEQCGDVIYYGEDSSQQ
ncbi:MAG: hypothetical protein IKA49_03825 [Alistipes sp.]|nr:hypothetical protein [Alistipes sp.]